MHCSFYSTSSNPAPIRNDFQSYSFNTGVKKTEKKKNSFPRDPQKEESRKKNMVALSENGKSSVVFKNRLRQSIQRMEQKAEKEEGKKKH